MSEVQTTPESPEPSRATGFAGLPRWLRIALIAAAAAVLALVLTVVVRVILQTPVIPLGSTAADRLMPGACLLESGQADSYTVVPCSSPHQQQVIANVDLDFPGVPYSADSALAVYAQETCNRLLEYKLYLPKDLEKAKYAMAALSVPTLDQYTAGDTTTFCAILDDPETPDAGGTSADLTNDLYRSVPS